MKNNSRTHRARVAGVCLMFIAGSVTSVHASSTTEAFTIYDSQLQRVHLATAALTPVSALDRAIADIALAPDGRLLGVDPTVDALVEIDTMSAGSTMIGSLGVDVPPPTGPVGLDFDQEHGLWLLANAVLYEVDVTTGSATQICDLSGLPFADYCRGLAWHKGSLYCAYDGIVAIDPAGCTTSMAIPSLGDDSLFSDDQFLYGIRRTPVGPFGDGFVTFFRADPPSQEYEYLGVDDVEIDEYYGLAGIPRASIDRGIPVLGAHGAGILAFLLAMAGFIVLRCRLLD